MSAQHVETPLSGMTLGDLRDLLEAVDHLPDSHLVDVGEDNVMTVDWATP